MINANMRLYDYFTLGLNDYGDTALSSEAKGQIKISINETNYNLVNNILYKDCSYIGLTYAEIDDTFVIQYGDIKLKVKHVNPQGRYKQVFMGLYE